MSLRILLKPDGSSHVESISILEDLWHDFQYFKRKATNVYQPNGPAQDLLTAKRYRRVALLTLVFYFEGVVNRYVAWLLPKNCEWLKLELEPLDRKIDIIQARLSAVVNTPSTEIAKGLRDELVHFKSAFRLTQESLAALSVAGIPADVLSKLQELQDQEYYGKQFLQKLRQAIGKDMTKRFQDAIVNQALRWFIRVERILFDGWQES